MAPSPLRRAITRHPPYRAPNPRSKERSRGDLLRPPAWPSVPAMSRYTLSLMRWRLRLWFVLIGTGSLIAFPPAIHAQCPRGAGGKVVIQRAQTTLPDEMRDGQNETGEEAPHPKVRVEDVTIEGAPDLQESIRRKSTPGCQTTILKVVLTGSASLRKMQRKSCRITAILWQR